MQSDQSDYSDCSVSGKRKIKCPFPGCHAAYTKKWKLVVHERKHTGIRPFTCDVPGCDKTYTNVAHLKRHKCLKHDKTEEFVCNHHNCGKKFNYKYNLRRHIARNHNADKYAFHCAECNQGFQKKKQLQQHLYLHTGQMSFECASCDIKFSTLRDYNKHKSNHKTYTCDCGNKFHRWTLFCAHKRDVCKETYTCPICGKNFSQSSNLKSHTLTHVHESNRKVFKCPHENCNREYFYKNNLNQHIRHFHEKIRENLEINCTYPNCITVLSSKKCLKQHIKSIHERVKIPKVRKPRKDKGVIRKKMSSFLSGINQDSGRDGFKVLYCRESTNTKKKEGEKDETEALLQDVEHTNVKLVDQDDVLLNVCDTILNNLKDKLNKME